MTRAEKLAKALEWEAEALELRAKAKRMRAEALLDAAGEQARPDEFLTLREASKRFGLSIRQLREAIKRGKLPERLRGERGYLVSPAEVVNLVEINRVQPPAAPSSEAKARANVNRLLEAGKLVVLKRE